MYRRKNLFNDFVHLTIQSQILKFSFEFVKREFEKLSKEIVYDMTLNMV